MYLNTAAADGGLTAFDQRRISSSSLLGLCRPPGQWYLWCQCRKATQGLRAVLAGCLPSHVHEGSPLSLAGQQRRRNVQN
jgi:hypothetical protein